MDSKLESKVAGAYHFIAPVITIEASERIGRPPPVTFLHESTHKFLTELTDLGFLVRRLYEFLWNRAIDHPLVREYLLATRRVQEILATNTAHLFAPLVGVSRGNYSDELTADYKNYLNELAEFHTYLVDNMDRDSHLILLQLGLCALGAPGLSTLSSVDVAGQHKDWSAYLKQEGVDPDHRFNVATNVLRDCIEAHGNNVEAVVTSLREDFPLSTALVTSSSIQRYVESLEEGDWRDLVQKSSSGYAEDGVQLTEYYRRVKCHAARETSIHFNCRVYQQESGCEDLLKVVMSEPSCFLHIYHNRNSFAAEQVVSVPAGMCLILWAAYDRPFADEQSTSPNEAKMRRTGYSLVSFADCQRILAASYDSNVHIVVGEWNSFDLARQEYMGMPLPGNRRLLLHKAFLSMAQLESIFFSLVDKGVKVDFHMVHECNSSTGFVCFRPQEGDGWMFIAPGFPDLREVAEMEMVYPLEHVRQCVSLDDFGTTNELECQIVAFIRHYTVWGW